MIHKENFFIVAKKIMKPTCNFYSIPVNFPSDKQAIALPPCKEESLDSFGGIKVNGLPPKGEDKWNRKQVQPVLNRAGVKSAKLYVERDQIGR